MPVSRAQRSTISASRASCARYGGALQTRDRNEFRVCDDPASAVHTACCTACGKRAKVQLFTESERAVLTEDNFELAGRTGNSPAPIDAAQNRGADQNTDAQGDADGDQRAVFGLGAHARQGVAAVTGAELERIAAIAGAEF